ncbi:hypothetical protein FJTKL_12082 [Diaporthe vaccinii]|uniref:Restriction endonuclease domain-containing protein n=1 Tax=Diaporthe vaccinii TaxID=105482 RepID=A0ABR4EF21_9PEZI
MPYQGFEDWRRTKHPQSSVGGGNKSFSDILPGAASLSLEAPVPFEHAADKGERAAASACEAVENPFTETARAPAAIAEQNADSLAVLTRNAARKRAEELLQLIRSPSAIKEKAEGDVFVFGDFSKPAYGTFCELVEADHDLDRRLKALRREYSHEQREFVIRMPSKIHDGMAEFVGGKIGYWLESLMEIGDTATPNQHRAGIIAKDITPYGTADISILSNIKDGDDKDIRQADKSYEYEAEDSKNTLPDVVIEVIWSHPRTRAELTQRAEKYILNSRGDIRTVVTIDLLDFYPDPSGDGKKSKSGKLSILRAKVDKKNNASIDEARSIRVG